MPARSPGSRSGPPRPARRRRSSAASAPRSRVSMTDRADWAVCVVGPGDLAVGCDLELVEARTDAFVRDWFTPAERDLVFGAEPGERRLLANLVCRPRRAR